MSMAWFVKSSPADMEDTPASGARLCSTLAVSLSSHRQCQLDIIITVISHGDTEAWDA